MVEGRLSSKAAGAVLALTAFLAVLPAASLLAAFLLLPSRPAAAAQMRIEDYEAGPYALGGDFTLTNQLGKKTTLQQYKGRVVLVFFGYTYCPDVCPTTLTEIAQMQKKLGQDARRVQPLFISVDPERDTAPRLKSYLSNFNAGIVGLTGTEAEIREVATRYQARFARHPGAAKDGYLVDHTGFVYMLDGTGKVRYLFTYDAGADLLAQGARKLLKG